MPKEPCSCSEWLTCPPVRLKADYFQRLILSKLVIAARMHHWTPNDYVSNCCSDVAWWLFDWAGSAGYFFRSVLRMCFPLAGGLQFVHFDLLSIFSVDLNFAAFENSSASKESWTPGSELFQIWKFDMRRTWYWTHLLSSSIQKLISG